MNSKSIATMSSTEEKSLCVIELSGSAKDWEIWSEKFKAQGKRKGYTKLPLGGQKSPLKPDFQLQKIGKTDRDKKVTQLGDLNELGYEGLHFIHQWGVCSR